jgi:hypothetical protein
VTRNPVRQAALVVLTISFYASPGCSRVVDSRRRCGEGALAEGGDAGTSQPRKSRVSEGITSQVMARTINTLSSKVLSSSGQVAINGPSAARIAVITV